MSEALIVYLWLSGAMMFAANGARLWASIAWPIIAPVIVARKIIHIVLDATNGGGD